MGKELYQEVPKPEDLVQQIEKIQKGELPDTVKSGGAKDWRLIAKESLTNLKGEIDSILSLKLLKKTRMDELDMIYQRLLQKRKHARDSDKKFSRQESEGASAYLEEKIKAVEAEQRQ